MSKHVYCIFDNGAEVWFTPMVCENSREALRYFMAAVRNPDSIMYEFPQDYALYEIGSFEDGRIVGYDSNKLILRGEHVEDKKSI